jgi:hypothetical protein
MIQIVGVRKADKEEPPHYELAYVDLDKKQNEKGYFQTTKYGTEAESPQAVEVKRSAGRRD